ncbi:hypothetical protein Rhe02_65840 [Rhizocola hellebori]|uniref:O-antigen ligase-related domain-containing protein n=1 Tax=Rhizocola hellebori TaxID=1392758 RepID=A0A8J3VJJ3_9ACTN|nr:O-antigen ligase family protein [Rhizocola hellebori]GIH08517.1 hypothetical protein Rhe02_65840 [Rhizocola hellebori]
MRNSVLRRVLSVTLVLLLLVVLTESWIQALTHTESLKTIKNGVYLLLLAATATLITRQRRWREFRTGADFALAALAVVIVLSGVAGSAAPLVIGQAFFVYLRSVIVFYAIRALAPSATWIRAVLWIAGGWAALNCVIGVVQVTLGPPAYTALGWTDLSTAQIHRAQGLFAHPNDLGHLAGLALLAVLAVADKRRWWALAALFAAGLAVSQSRESLFGVAAGCVIIAAMRRLPLRHLCAGFLAVVALAAIPIVLSHGVRTEVQRRMWGVVDAMGLPIAHERPEPDPALPVCGPPQPRQDGVVGSPCRHPGPDREIRILYAQQSFRLLARRPVLGYGAGTFGGIVALQTDPDWHRHPRLGPNGFDLFGFHGKTVDSFWLHLMVELGLVGLGCYLLWLAMLARRLRHRPAAVAALAFAVVVAVFSPALESPMFAPLLFGLLGLDTIRTHLYRGGSLYANSEATDRGGAGWRNIPSQPGPGCRAATGTSAGDTDRRGEGGQCRHRVASVRSCDP